MILDFYITPESSLVVLYSQSASPGNLETTLQMDLLCDTIILPFRDSLINGILLCADFFDLAPSSQCRHSPTYNSMTRPCVNLMGRLKDCLPF